jgi:hypothetical protein
MMSRPDITMDRGRSQFTRNQTYDAGPSFMMSNSQVGRFPEASFSEDPLDEDIIRKNNAGIDAGGHMDSQSSVSAFGEGQGDSSVIKETEAAQLEEI